MVFQDLQDQDSECTVRYDVAKRMASEACLHKCRFTGDATSASYLIMRLQAKQSNLEAAVAAAQSSKLEAQRSAARLSQVSAGTVDCSLVGDCSLILTLLMRSRCSSAPSSINH